MVRLGRKNRSPGDKETALQNADSKKSRGLRFRRQKGQRKNACNDVASSNAPDLAALEVSEDLCPSTIRQFSYHAEMAILHNSVNSANEDRNDFPPPPTTVLKTRSVMRFALQSRMYEEKTYHETWENLCEDPTVEESIECVFEHQLEDGLQMNVEEDDESCMDNEYNNSSAYSQSHYTSGKLVQVGSFSPFHKKRFDNDALLYDLQPSKSARSKFANFTCSTCRDGKECYIGAPPKTWPQAPLMLRPTPGSGTGIIGVRYADSKEYLTSQWWNDIPNKNKVGVTVSHSFCSKCCCLPINNGSETLGKSLVVDFESNLFQGTLHVRIRNSNATSPEPREGSTGYFDGLNRTYQCVVQGRFKREGIPMIRCVAGQSFTQHLNLPPIYVAKGIIRIMNFFAPRLHVKIEGNSPFFVSPLGSTPQTVKIDKVNGTSNTHFQASTSISEEQEEPIDQSRQIVPIKVGKGSTANSRSKARKKAFDKLCTHGDDTLTFDTNRVYSFEFLQHLVDFDTFDLKLGNVLGKINLSQALNAQPLKIMAAHQRSEERTGLDIFDNLWSFDLMHEKVYDAMHEKS